MPSLGGALSIGGSIIGGLMSSKAQKSAASSAADAQVQAAQMGVEEQRRQFDAVRKLLEPYVAAGPGALTAQQNLIGLGGTAAQKAAIAGISSSPEMQSLIQQGENAIRQNASATGGLRGGNIQAALAQFRPQILSQLIQQRFQNLGGLTTLGQRSAAGVGDVGMQAGGNIANLLAQQGAAQAGSALASGQANANMWANISSGLGALGGGVPGGIWNLSQPTQGVSGVGIDWSKF